jgi:aminoglycoside 6'-N-acetyltransferase
MAWGGGPADMSDVDTHRLVIIHDGRVVGAIQWAKRSDPDYRLHRHLPRPGVHGLGLGTDAVRTLARHLFTAHGHYRLVIDPAADNQPAIHAHAKVGFHPVGIMRRYERAPDGTRHDVLLMDLLPEDRTDG